MLEPMFDRIRSQHGLIQENVYQFQTLKSAYGALTNFHELQEDASAILGIANTYSQSIIYDLLERIRTLLLEIYQHVLVLFNNYVLNNAKLCEKYQDLILERFSKLDGTIRYYTYPYDGLYTYPKDLRSEGKAEKAAQEIIKIGEDPLTTPDILEAVVDKKIKEFSYAMLGARVNTYELKDDTKKICYSKMQGERYVETLTKDNLKKYIEEIQKYKELRDEIKSLKKEINGYYTDLKKSFSNTFKMIPGPTGELVRMTDPTKAILLDKQVIQFSTAKIQLNRLFNGYITLYSEAFKAKLDIIQQHINTNRAVIVAVMTRTNVLYAVNGKPDKTTPDNKDDPLYAEIIT